MSTRPNRSLAARLAQTLIVSVGGIWLACLIGVGWYVGHEIDENFDKELAESAHRLLDTAVYELDRAAPASPAPVVATQPIIENEEPLVYQLRSTEGRVLVRTAAAPPQAFAVPLHTGFRNSGPWRVYTAQHPGRPLYLQLADPLQERRDALNSTLIGLLLPMLAVLPLLALLLRGIARRELRVLHQLKAEIGQRNGSDLRPIALSRMPQELQSVGDDVNRLLERLSHALDVERALAANAAHELRTPLAAVRLRLQTALDEGLARQDVQAALDALGVLSHRTEKLLQLSRAESAAALGQSRVDLVQLAAAVAEEFWQSAAVQQQLDLSVPETEVQPVLGDVDALAIALRNLVENALRYAAGARVEIEVLAPSTLVVRDHGPGVDAARLATLQQRHVRHANDQAGYGLGLSIVGSIVQKHRGQLVLVSPLPGGHAGFEARIVLPVPA
ncbi:MAG TPA: ATP-binding protein [Burkholderiaceae bacterium]|nr:ATP-binding protein [Burkholderiaceae bacterium]